MEYKRYIIAGMIFSQLCFGVQAVYAWGSLTHMGLILEAGQKTGLPVAKEYMGAFLAGATEPDIGVMSSGAASVNSNYFVYHDALFVEAMKNVAMTKKTPEKEILLARAMGYAAHLKGDSVAHAVEGYSNAKQVYTSIKKYDKANHLTTEFAVDTLTYAKNKKEFDKYKVNFIDVDTLIAVRNEYAKIKGITLESDRDKLKVDILKHRATVITDQAVAENIMSKNPGMLKEMDEFFKDRFAGLDASGGIDKSVDLLADAFKNGDIMKVEKQKDSRNILARAGSMASKVINTAANEGVELTEKALMNFARIGFIKEKASTIANSKLKGNESLIGNFLINAVSDKKISFKEVLYNAEIHTADLADPEIKLKMAKAELDILKKKSDAAYKEYNERPWYKFWLYFTKSDKNKYENLKVLYDAKKSEIEKLEAELKNAAASNKNLQAVTAASEDGKAEILIVNDNASAVNCNEPTGADGSNTELTAAYERYKAAYKAYINAGAPETGTDFEEYKRALEAYRQLSKKNQNN
ncbi:MAG: zinc dependent phospholipase C family protein [Candidatus Wallbacteria bacterium]